jgi:hypothetical protein
MPAPLAVVPLSTSLSWHLEGAAEESLAATAAVLNRWTSPLGCEGDDQSDEDRYQRDRAPPMLPERSHPVVALTTRPEESEQDEQSAR